MESGNKGGGSDTKEDALTLVQKRIRNRRKRLEKIKQLEDQI